MKYRKSFVANSSSCSFTCFISGGVIDGWDWNDPIENGMYECEKCSTHFLISEIEKYRIRVYPDRKGYIKEKNCPFCNGYKVERILLKPGDKVKIISEDEINEN
jgi:hypothetical protein